MGVRFFSNYPGGNAGGVTPLPIPNRVVKPSRAHGTMLVTTWESRSPPGLFLIKTQKINNVSKLEVYIFKFLRQNTTVV